MASDLIVAGALSPSLPRMVFPDLLGRDASGHDGFGIVSGNHRGAEQNDTPWREPSSAERLRTDAGFALLAVTVLRRWERRPRRSERLTFRQTRFRQSTITGGEESAIGRLRATAPVRGNLELRPAFRSLEERRPRAPTRSSYHRRRSAARASALLCLMLLKRCD